MKALLAAIRTALQGSTDLSYVTDTNIFVTADENLIPVTVGFPAIGIKDGSILRVTEDSQTWEPGLFVNVFVYQILKEGDVSIMGQTDPRIYGVLEIADGIHAVLYDNKLGISGMEVALPQDEGESEWMAGEDLSLVKKRVTYRYQKLEANP
ncbi:MAG: hypothetical protein RAO92_05800 [Candidatus Euphemobacter frigidus]|nr:hypothetical protein [Candidatus Euphemobacter frigidus]